MSRSKPKPAEHDWIPPDFTTCAKCEDKGWMASKVCSESKLKCWNGGTEEECGCSDCLISLASYKL